MNSSQRKKEAARCVLMSEKTVPTENETIEQLITLVERSEPEELRKLLIGYLKSRRTDLRNFIRYCSERASADDTIDPGWTALCDNLARLEMKEREDALQSEKKKYLRELEQFREECISGEYSLEADFDEKRRAYADGDIYFEEFIYDFFDDHPGIQGYIHYMKEALRYYNEGDFRTASKALEILIGIYGSDTEGKSIFIVDADFSDADLSEVPGVDIDKMRKCLKISEEKIGAALPGTTGSMHSILTGNERR